jgi:hypothetical protein
LAGPLSFSPAKHPLPPHQPSIIHWQVFALKLVNNIVVPTGSKKLLYLVDFNIEVSMGSNIAVPCGFLTIAVP